MPAPTSALIQVTSNSLNVQAPSISINVNCSDNMGRPLVWRTGVVLSTGRNSISAPLVAPIVKNAFQKASWAATQAWGPLRTMDTSTTGTGARSTSGKALTTASRTSAVQVPNPSSSVVTLWLRVVLAPTVSHISLALTRTVVCVPNPRVNRTASRVRTPVCLNSGSASPARPCRA